MILVVLGLTTIRSALQSAHHYATAISVLRKPHSWRRYSNNKSGKTTQALQLKEVFKQQVWQNYASLTAKGCVQTTSLAIPGKPYSYKLYSNNKFGNTTKALQLRVVFKQLVRQQNTSPVLTANTVQWEGILSKTVRIQQQRFRSRVMNGIGQFQSFNSSFPVKPS